MRTVTAMGETIMDILFRQGQPVAAVPGGSSFNSIISIGRTGLPCRFVGYTGRDKVGLETQAFLTKNGVSIEYFEVRKDEKSAISLAYLDENGDATYQFYKETPRASSDWLMPDFNRDDVLLYGSYYAVCDGMRPQVASILRTANEAGAILYYDLNFRRPHAHELEALLPSIHQNFRESTLVRGSADDFEIMYNSRDARHIYAEHISKYCPLFICTAGGGMITICTPTGAFDFQAPQLPNVVSTVGAGDSFNAGFIYGLVHLGITREQLPTLDRAGWKSLIHYATAFAAQACQSTDNFVSADFALSLIIMNHEMKNVPRIAIIDQNSLEATGLKNILSDIAPMAEVKIFSNVEEMIKNTDEMAPFVHFFVSSQAFIGHADFFLQRQRQTIVLTAQPIAGPQFSHFHTLHTARIEHELLKTVLTLFQNAHGRHGIHPTIEEESASELSAREAEVLGLIVRGFRNKEIADRLCISLPTVVTHRKNICEKLQLRSVSALTIYAVTHGIVSAEEI